MGITRRWGGNKEVGITRAGYHKEAEGVDKEVGITGAGCHKEVEGVDKEVGFTRTGYHKVRVHLPTSYKSHKP